MADNIAEAEVDLHMHSIFSDGSDSPEDIAKKAKHVKALSLTDHNNCEGFFEFMQACSEYNIDMISGIEITCNYYGERNIHLLGYGFQVDQKSVGLIGAAMDQGLEDSRKRGIDLLKQLQAESVINRLPDIDEINAEFSCRGPSVSIHHILHYCSNRSGIPYAGLRAEFGKGKKFWVEPPRDTMISFEETISLIASVGGVCVLAHPYKIVEDLGKSGFIKLLDRLMDRGLFGLEAYYARHNGELTKFFVKLADERGLFKTAGSDYHGIYKNRPIGQPGMTYNEFRRFKQIILEKRTI